MGLSIKAESLLGDLALASVDRALFLADQDPTSSTYGSLDRPFWYYRTLVGFAGASWQQPMVGFAALYATDHPSNPYSGFRPILSAAESALAAWCQTQHRGGSFDEWYRNEHSYCPTAITGLGAVVTLRLLENNIQKTIRSRVLSSVERAATWLSRRFNPNVMNQNLASAAMLAGLSQLSGDSEWLARGRSVLAQVQSVASTEGWLPEYGGFDFGYSTLSLDFLALASEFGLAALADPMADHIIDFLLEVTEAGNAIPGRIGSRGTCHAFPFGAIAFARRSAAAQRLAARILRLHADRLVPRPETVDDRYFSYFYFPNFALAFREAALRPQAVLHCEDPGGGEYDRPLSGLSGRPHHDARLTINRRLGGALALTRAGAAPLYHLGYTITGRNRRRYSSAVWTGVQSATHRVDGGFQASARFNKLADSRPLVRWALPIYFIQYLLVSSPLAEMFQAAVKRIMIVPQAPFPLELHRSVTFEAETIVVHDRLMPGRKLDIVDIDVTASIAIHSPSARQDRGDSMALEASTRRELVAQLRAGRPASLAWSIRIGAKVDVRLQVGATA